MNESDFHKLLWILENGFLFLKLIGEVWLFNLGVIEVLPFVFSLLFTKFLIDFF